MKLNEITSHTQFTAVFAELNSKPTAFCYGKGASKARAGRYMQRHEFRTKTAWRKYMRARSLVKTHVEKRTDSLSTKPQA